ncbi:MAG: gliding motility-associated C-terminal domain-containing protein [Saprospiraceae bacterium]
MNTTCFPINLILCYILPISLFFSANTAFSQDCPGLGGLAINIWPQPAPIIQAPAAICSGANASLIVKDTFAQYLWSNGATTKAISISMPGDYTVTVTNPGGCIGTSSVHIQAKDNPVPIIAGIVDTCLGQVLLSVGSGFAAVLWSNDSTTQAIMVTDSNTYSVIVTDSVGCKGTSTYTVNIVFQPPVSIAGDTSLCSGTPLTLAVMLPDTAIYVWSNGQTGTSILVATGGTYSVTATKSNGCVSMDSLKVKEVSFMPPSITGPDVMCDTTSALLSVSNSYAIYAWNTGADTSEIVASLSGVYSITVTDFNGCTGTGSHILSSVTSPTPVITAAPFACDGTLSLLTGANYADYLWSNNAAGSTITVDSSGAYAVTVTNAQGCTGTSSFVADIPPLPTVAISSLPSICQGVSDTLSVPPGFSQYVWNNGANNASVSIDSGGFYAVTVTDTFGCTATDTLTVENLLPPKPQISGLNQICTSGTATFSVTGSFDAYAWSTGANTSSISVNTAGVFTVTVTAANGCTATDTHTLISATNLQPQIQESPYTCNGQINLDAGTGFSIYQWSTGQTGQSIAVVLSGNYSVTVGDGNGCTGSTVAVVTIPSSPNVEITGDSIFCSGATAILSASPNFTQYAWSSGEISSNILVAVENTYTVTVTDQQGCTATNNVFVQALPNPSIGISQLPYACDGQLVLNTGAGFSQYDWAGPGGFAASGPQTIVNMNGDYQVVVTDSQGCTGAASIIVAIPAQILVELNGPVQICPGGTANMDASAGFGTYLWNTGSTQQSITVSAAGIYTVTATDGNGCTSSASNTVGLFPTPVPLIAGPTSVCPGAAAMLSVDSAYSTILWSNGASSASILITPPLPISVTVTDGNGCSGTASTQITVSPLPPLSITGNPTLCSGQTNGLMASGGFSSYIWSNGETASDIFVTQADTYFVTATDAFGCTVTSSFDLNSAPPLNISIAQQAYLCDQQLSLSAGSGFDSYLWSNGNSGPAIQVVQSGTYTVTVTNALGCSGTAFIQAEIPASPFVHIDGLHSLCSGGSALLTASGNALTYTWSNGITGPTISISQAGTYSVVATDAYGCTALENHTVNLALPIASTLIRTTCNIMEAGTQVYTFTAANGCDSVQTIVTTYEPVNPGYALVMDSQIDANLGQQIQINVEANFVIDSVAFHSPFSLSCYDCVNPTMIALDSGFIIVEAFDQEGCFTSGEIRISVNKSVNIYVPNVFSPGSDENGFLSVFSGPGVQELRNFHVYDRWGNALFARETMPTNTPGSGWDGTFRNQPMMPGVYVYYFEVLLKDGSTVKYKGDVTIVK